MDIYLELIKFAAVSALITFLLMGTAMLITYTYLEIARLIKEFNK